MRFQIYCNIRKKTLSVKALEGPFKGRVVAGVERMLLADAEFRVSEAGRQRVINSGHKNVHAGVIGRPIAVWGAVVRDDLDPATHEGLGASINNIWPVFRGERVSYNPFKTRTFVRAGTRKKVSTAKRVLLDRCAMKATGINK